MSSHQQTGSVGCATLLGLIPQGRWLPTGKNNQCRVVGTSRADQAQM